MTHPAVEGLIIGISVAVFAATPALLVLETATAGGLRRGLSAGAGVANADGLWAVLFVTLGASAGVLHQHWTRLWKWVAVAALLAVGVGMVRNLLRSRSIPAHDPLLYRQSPATLYRRLLAATLTEPVTAVFFLSLMAGSAGVRRPAEAAALVAGVAAGSMCWQGCLAAVGARRSTPFSPVAHRRLRWIDCALLAVFTVYIAVGT